MDDFDIPLDLDGDGDDVIEMGLFLDDEKKKGSGGRHPQGGSGCCVILLAMGNGRLEYGEVFSLSPLG